MSIADEARAELARNAIEWLTPRKPEAAPSDTDWMLECSVVIAEALRFMDDSAMSNVDTLKETERILSQSPTDALQAHDRQVAAKALTDAATDAQQEFVDEQNGIGFARVRTDWLTARAAAIVSEPSTPEQEGQSDV